MNRRHFLQLTALAIIVPALPAPRTSLKHLGKSVSFADPRLWWDKTKIMPRYAALNVEFTQKLLDEWRRQWPAMSSYFGQRRTPS